MKLERKKEKASERKEKFKTGGGPPVTITNSQTDSLLENQKPLTGVLDDDHLEIRAYSQIVEYSQIV